MTICVVTRVEGLWEEEWEYVVKRYKLLVKKYKQKGTRYIGTRDIINNMITIVNTVVYMKLLRE